MLMVLVMFLKCHDKGLLNSSIILTLVIVVKMLAFCVLNRERPKYQLKEDAETPRNGPKAVGESTDTVKVTRDIRGEETVRARWVDCVD